MLWQFLHAVSCLCVEEIQPLFWNNEITVSSVKNMDNKEEFGTYSSDVLEENPNEVLPTLGRTSTTDINIL